MPRRPDFHPSDFAPRIKYIGFDSNLIEDEHEKALRLHKERIRFYSYVIAPYVFCLLILGAMASYCFWALFDKSTTLEERRYVWAAISAVMGGIVGIVFGRSTR